MAMKQFNGYKDAPAFDGEYETLQLGGHSLIIKGPKIEKYSWGEVLILAIDIAEGEHKGFYQRQYDRKKTENPDYKWPGTYRQNIPNDDGTDADNKRKGFFKGMISAIEKSNPGYTWNWDENSLTGKKVGGVFGQEEFLDRDGNVRLATKCFNLRSLDAVRKGIDAPELKKLKSEQAKPAQFKPDDDTSLPFDL